MRACSQLLTRNVLHKVSAACKQSTQHLFLQLAARVDPDISSRGLTGEYPPTAMLTDPGLP